MDFRSAMVGKVNFAYLAKAHHWEKGKRDAKYDACARLRPSNPSKAFFPSPFIEWLARLSLIHDTLTA